MKLFLNKKFIFIVKVVVGLAIYVYLLNNKKIDYSFLSPQFGLLLLQLFIIQVVMLFVGALRWCRVVAHVYTEKPPYMYVVIVSLVGQFFSLILPATIGTDFNRVYLVQKKMTIDHKQLIYATVLDRICAFVAVTICGLLGIVFYVKNLPLAFSSVYLSAVFIFIQFLYGRRAIYKSTQKQRKFPPAVSLHLSIIIIMLKTLSFILIISSLQTMVLSDYYICFSSQFLEAIAIVPANIGLGHILFDNALAFIEGVNGAQIYNIYFTVKIFFKLTGFITWLFMRP
jgi:hypothetical protein